MYKTALPRHFLKINIDLCFQCHQIEKKNTIILQGIKHLFISNDCDSRLSLLNVRRHRSCLRYEIRVMSMYRKAVRPRGLEMPRRRR